MGESSRASTHSRTQQTGPGLDEAELAWGYREPQVLAPSAVAWDTPAWLLIVSLNLLLPPPLLLLLMITVIIVLLFRDLKKYRSGIMNFIYYYYFFFKQKSI